MTFGFDIVQGRARTVSGKISRALPLVLMTLAMLLCAGCHRTPDAAPIPPGPPMSPAQATAARAQVINNDPRLTPEQKQAALQRLGVQSSQ